MIQFKQLLFDQHIEIKDFDCPKCKHIVRVHFYVNDSAYQRYPLDYNNHLFIEMADTITQQNRLINELLKR